MNKLKLIQCILLILLFTACTKQKDKGDIETYIKSIEQWREERLSRLTSENGWLTLCGLFWLKNGENKIGADSSNDVIFPHGKAPKFAGSIFLGNDKILLKAGKRSEIKHKDSLITSMVIQFDENGHPIPTVFTLGPLSFQLIKRGDKIGVRVRNKENPARINFKGLEYFPIDPKWKIEASFEKYDPPKIIPIMNILNQIEDRESPGALVFKVNGNLFRLDALQEKGTNELFIIFADETRGKETYDMGRYLYTELPNSENKVIIDFNKAYNPPCAFTEFATCPVPPIQNHIKLRVEAGEKKYQSNLYRNEE